MPKSTSHVWEFKARFRRKAFGWQSQSAIVRIQQAISEIKRVARKNPILAAEGAVLFLERLSPALENVDGSSGAIGGAANHAITELAAIIANAPADVPARRVWLDRLWQAYADDGYGYVDYLLYFWGDLCASKELASKWADSLAGTLRTILAQPPGQRGFFGGTTACYAALLKAERYDKLFQFLELEPKDSWHDRQWGFQALVAQGRKADAIRYAEASRSKHDSRNASIAQACEEVLLASGLEEEAYKRYAIAANQRGTYLATYRSIAKKYPHKNPKELFDDLVASTPGEEGKWFATAKALGLYEEAILLANTSPCNPQTLARAARDFNEKQPVFALEAGIAALRWISEGYGYEITSLDVSQAYHEALSAAQRLDHVESFQSRAKALIESHPFLRDVLSYVLRS